MVIAKNLEESMSRRESLPHPTDGRKIRNYDFTIIVIVASALSVALVGCGLYAFAPDQPASVDTEASSLP